LKIHICSSANVHIFEYSVEEEGEEGEGGGEEEGFQGEVEGIYSYSMNKMNTE